MNQPPKRYIRFMQDHPDIATAYDQLGRAVSEAGPLDTKQIALVKVGISAGARMQGALRSHARKALSAGLTKEEIKHAILLTTPTIGFPNMMAALSCLDDLAVEGENEQE